MKTKFVAKELEYEIKENARSWSITCEAGKVKASLKLSKDDFKTLEEVQKYLLELE